MLLINLPCELIILISEFLEAEDLNALVQTASHFANLLDLYLLDRGLTDPKLEILLWAAAKADEEIIRKILARAQNKHINIPSQIKDTMLMAAVCQERVDLLEYLVRTVGANVSAMVPYKYMLMPRTPLHEAAERGDAVTAQELMGLGADLDAIDAAGLSSLHYAVWMPGRGEGSADGDWECTDEELELGENLIAILRLLLELGAETEFEEPHRAQTPLLWASIDGNTEAIRLLLDHGADITATDSEGCTALHFAAGSREHNAVELLIAKGADIFAIDHNGDPPLNHSASVSVREILIEAGALKGPDLGRQLERLSSDLRTNDE